MNWNDPEEVKAEARRLEQDEDLARQEMLGLLPGEDVEDGFHRRTAHELDHDTDACQCGGQWVYFEPYRNLGGAYGCEAAGHEHAVDNPRDTHGRKLVPDTEDWE